KGNYVATLDTYAEVELTPQTVAFVKKFKERFHKAPTYTASTYDAIHLLKDVIEKAGTTDADKLVPVLEKGQFTGPAANPELTYAGMGMALAAAASVLAVTALSLVCYRLVIEPVRQHEAAVLIATIALGLIFQESMLRLFGGHYLGIPNAVQGVTRVLGVTIP